MNDRPSCGICGKIMTPENSRIRPELFLCDACTDPSHAEMAAMASAPKRIDEAAELWKKALVTECTCGIDAERSCRYCNYCTKARAIIVELFGEL